MHSFLPTIIFYHQRVQGYAISCLLRIFRKECKGTLLWWGTPFPAYYSGIMIKEWEMHSFLPTSYNILSSKSAEVHYFLPNQDLQAAKLSVEG